MPRMQGKFSDKEVEEDIQEEGERITFDNLKKVLLLGKITEILKISGFSFEISTLSSGEQREIVSKIMKMQSENKVFDIRPLTITYCLKTINGVQLEDLCEDDSIKDKVDRRLDVVLNMQTNLVDRIFRVYEKLLEESNKQIGLEDIKK
jgi:hypothetical protein